MARRLPRDVHGFVQVPAYLSRTGVQEYQAGPEYREPSEVFAPESLATFEEAPVVVGHPGKVTPGDFRAVVVGEVHNARRDGDFVAADLLIRDEDTIDRIEAGGLVEISCGYDCMIEVNPRDGRSYQTKIRINHIGLGPRNWGRAGAAVAIKAA